MSAHFQRANLRGRSFRAQEMSGIDFSHADIRGADFSKAVLVGANFSHCQAGLQVWWARGLTIGALLLAALSGFIAGYASSMGASISNLPAKNFTVWQQLTLPIIALTVLALLLVILYRRGLGPALAAFALIMAVAVALVAAFANVEVVATTLLLVLGVAPAIAGVVGLATAIAIVMGIVDLRSTWLVIAVAIGGMVPGIGEGVYGLLTHTQLSSSDVPIGSLLVTIGVAVVLLIISPYIGWQAMAGNKKYSLIRTLVIALLTKGGTSLRGANLTYTDFSHALLKNSDLRDTVLTCTNLFQAQQIDRARTEMTYLALPELRQLAVSKDGHDQNYDYLNLQGINLKGANLTNTSFIDANLGEATLQDADLSRAKLVHTQLYNTDLRGACLTGAYIEEWNISTNTRFDDIRCAYVYMRLPTPEDPDPWRKPDNKQENFQVGDFADFIAPIIKTLHIYRQQYIDPRTVGRVFKTLDLFHHEQIDPTASAIALKQLADRYPEAGLEVVALEGRGQDKIHLQAAVAESADRSALSADYTAIYNQIKLLPQEDLQGLLTEVSQSDEKIRSLEKIVMAARQSERFYVQTYINLGGPMMAKAAVQPQVTCLFFAANPLDTQRLSLDREIREITAKIRASEYRDALQLISEWAVRPDDLIQSLNTYKPQIVHFSGHGTDTSEIILEDNQGLAKAVTTTALKALFTTLKDNIKLVILNACYSEVQAKAITEVIDCAIGISSAISDEAAITFVASCYRAIGFGRSIQEAFDQGVTALLLEGIPEEHKPQLLKRSGVDPTSIKLIEPNQ